MFTQRASGNLALVVSLLMMFNLINLFATPLTLQALGATPSANIVYELLGMFFTILGFQVVPLVTGVQLRERRPALAEKVSRYGKIFANVLLFAAVIGVGVTQADLVTQLELSTVAAVEFVTIVALISGWLCIPGDHRTKTAGALSNTMRSQSLALLLASTRFPSPETLLAVITYSVLMFFNGFIASEILRRFINKPDPPSKDAP
jgi:predicted Na+-dependent transporter